MHGCNRADVCNSQMKSAYAVTVVQNVEHLAALDSVLSLPRQPLK